MRSAYAASCKHCEHTYLRSAQLSATLLIYVPIKSLSKSTNTVREHHRRTGRNLWGGGRLSIACPNMTSSCDDVIYI